MWLIFMDRPGVIAKEKLIPGIKAARKKLHGSAEKPYIILILSKWELSESGGIKLSSDQGMV